MSHTDTIALDLLDAGRELTQEIERQKRANERLLRELEDSLRALRELVDRPLPMESSDQAGCASRRHIPQR